ncbi:MAG: metal ABC transporter substrate-binding protein [Chloroflexi bacterium]|nr:metal ABC transporter substrate-binding protein [Chloroflexota bacterium]
MRAWKGPAYGLATALVLAAVIACSDTEEESPDDGVLRVVTTVSPITSLVENIGGTRIRLEGIIPEWTNSHTFSPSPSVARVMAEADLIVLNGLFLEEPSLEMAMANKKDGAVILTLGDKAISPEEWVFDFSFPESDGHPNPHLWTSPILALKYAELIRDELVALDASNAGYYRENYAKLEARIEDLDRRISAAFQTVPVGNRKLLTYHDSFPLFASRYGLEIIGAVQPSDFREPSAREVARLIDQVRETGVPAIFGSEVFPSPVMRQIAKEGGAKFIDQLRDDDLPGSSGDPRHTYLGLMLTNIEVMIPALGGSADAMSGFDPGPVFEGASGAKYPE